MKLNRLLVTALVTGAFAVSAWAQTQIASNAAPESGPTPAAAVSPATTPAIAIELQELKEAIAAQKNALEAQQRQIQALEQQLQRKTEVAELQPASSAPSGIPALAGVLAVQGGPQTSAPEAPQTYDKQMEGPLTIHFRGINITPGGFVEGAFVRRSRALGADLPTPFNSVTMPGASQSTLPEFFGSGRQSKITTFADGRAGNVDLSAYVSADFLSAGVTSTSNETNSYTLRLRQAWGQAKFTNGWSFLAGQTWSLVTENGFGISPDDDLGRTNDARPRTIDPSYSVGFVFARQFGLRVTKSFGNKVAFAVGIENPQATLTTHGNADNFLLGEAGASNSYNTTSTYSFNPSPDVIAKIAFDPGFGHYEVFGLYNRFKDRVFPCVDTYTITTTTPPTVVVRPGCPSTADAGTAMVAYNTSKDGGGFGASARWNIFNKHLTFGLKGFGGSGVGRYGPGGLPDASIRADGSLRLVRNMIGLSTLEWSGKKFTLYAYAGSEYAGRAGDWDPLLNTGTGGYIGYGAPGFKDSGCYAETPPVTTGTAGFNPGSLASCTADTRAVTEGTAGFWYRFYSGPRGRLQFGIQNSYVNRATWSGAKSLEPHGLDEMVFTSFRYYLP